MGLPGIPQGEIGLGENKEGYPCEPLSGETVTVPAGLGCYTAILALPAMSDEKAPWIW